MPKQINKNNMKCNSPRALRKGEAGYGKKKKVVLGCKSGRQKLIKYGAKGYEHNYSDSAKKSFRARHNCSEKKDQTNQFLFIHDYSKKNASPIMMGKDLQNTTPSNVQRSCQK